MGPREQKTRDAARLRPVAPHDHLGGPHLICGRAGPQSLLECATPVPGLCGPPGLPATCGAEALLWVPESLGFWLVLQMCCGGKGWTWRVTRALALAPPGLTWGPFASLGPCVLTCKLTDCPGHPGIQFLILLPTSNDSRCLWSDDWVSGGKGLPLPYSSGT